tara:strand:+ start:224 stop:865 length:642 start_codon:yes stop_codon:yes gene_type:complete
MANHIKTHTPLLVLASKSPRRIEIIGGSWPHSFAIKPSREKEDKPNKNEAVQSYTSRIALEKVSAISNTEYPNTFFVGADTAVSVDGSILLKPSSEFDALKMLEKLRGREHIVSTSISISSALINQPLIVSKTTMVQFRNYTRGEMNQYVTTEATFDKSGGYAIQDRQFKPAAKIDGCYLNVVGLPICALKTQIDKISPDYAKSIKLLSCNAC